LTTCEDDVDDDDFDVNDDVDDAALKGKKSSGCTTVSRSSQGGERLLATAGAINRHGLDRVFLPSFDRVGDLRRVIEKVGWDFSLCYGKCSTITSLHVREVEDRSFGSLTLNQPWPTSGMV
jgi:hypothetical protein